MKASPSGIVRAAVTARASPLEVLGAWVSHWQTPALRAVAFSYDMPRELRGAALIEYHRRTA